MTGQVQASIAVISFPKTLDQLENFLAVDERSGCPGDRWCGSEAEIAPLAVETVWIEVVGPSDGCHRRR